MDGFDPTSTRLGRKIGAAPRSNRAVERALATERATPSDASSAALASRQRATKESAMTFAIRNLSVLAYAQGFTLWHYRAGAGRIAEVQAPGFFDAACDMFAVGDIIMVSAVDGAVQVAVSTSGQTVNTAPMLATAPAMAMAAE